MADEIRVGSPAYEERMDALMAARLAQPLYGEPSEQFMTHEESRKRRGHVAPLDRREAVAESSDGGLPAPPASSSPIGESFLAARYRH